jgi:hypothetical protein
MTRFVGLADRICCLVGAFAAVATIGSVCSMLTATAVHLLMRVDTPSAMAVVVGTTVGTWAACWLLAPTINRLLDRLTGWLLAGWPRPALSSARQRPARHSRVLRPVDRWASQFTWCLTTRNWLPSTPRAVRRDLASPPRTRRR